MYSWRVLIADDTPLVRKLLHRRFSQNKLFHPLHWRIDEATTGEEAVVQFQHGIETEDPYNIVFMDEYFTTEGLLLSSKELRQLLGSEAAQRIRELESTAVRIMRIPYSATIIVSVSGKNDHETSIAYVPPSERGFDLVWGKPIPTPEACLHQLTLAASFRGFLV